jgi:hypothetical protein
MKTFIFKFDTTTYIVNAPNTDRAIGILITKSQDQHNFKIRNNILFVVYDDGTKDVVNISERSGEGMVYCYTTI